MGADHSCGSGPPAMGSAHSRRPVFLIFPRNSIPTKVKYSRTFHTEVSDLCCSCAQQAGEDILGHTVPIRSSPFFSRSRACVRAQHCSIGERNLCLLTNVGLLFGAHGKFQSHLTLTNYLVSQQSHQIARFNNSDNKSVFQSTLQVLTNIGPIEIAWPCYPRAQGHLLILHPDSMDRPSQVINLGFYLCLHRVENFPLIYINLALLSNNH